MRKIKDVLRLTHHGGLSARQAARSLNISRSTVKEYQQRAARAGLDKWTRGRVWSCWI
jgi:transposase